MVFRPSSSNTNSGMSWASDFGMGLAEKSYARAVFKLIDLGSTVENDSHDFYFGFNSTQNNKSIGNAGIYLRIEDGEIYVTHKGSSLVENETAQTFSSFGTWIDCEIDYTADEEVLVTVKDLATGTVLHTFTITTEVPSYVTTGSGKTTSFQVHALKKTTGTVDFIAMDYVGFYAG